MKILILSVVFIIFSSVLQAQLNSGNMNAPATAQPVPNATTTEKSAPPQPQIVAPAPNPVPPIYPGAEVQAAEVQRQIINPPITVSGTQPVQKEPLSPVESTNTLQPNRPQREENSRVNPAVGVPNNSSKTKTFTKNNLRISNNKITNVQQKMNINPAPKNNRTVKKAKVQTKTFNGKKATVKKKSIKN